VDHRLSLAQDIAWGGEGAGRFSMRGLAEGCKAAAARGGAQRRQRAAQADGCGSAPRRPACRGGARTHHTVRGSRWGAPPSAGGGRGGFAGKVWGGGGASGCAARESRRLGSPRGGERARCCASAWHGRGSGAPRATPKASNRCRRPIEGLTVRRSSSARENAGRPMASATASRHNARLMVL
jgi:hypothetical protein